MSDRLTPFERAERYVEKIDGAVSGANGHNVTFNAACRVVEFGLSEEEAVAVMRGYNQRCDPPWSDSDLVHKVQDAFQHATHGKKLEGDRKPSYRAPKPEHRPTIKAPPPAPVVPDVTPVDLPEPIPNGAVEFLRAAFRPEDGVRIVKGIRNEEGKEHPRDDGVVLTCSEWVERLEKSGGDVNRFMSSLEGCGVYVGVNPVQVAGSTDADVTSYRHALLECDNLPVEVQYAILVASKVPCTALIFTGGKSIHAIVKVDARDRNEFDERVAALLAHFGPMGFDGKNKNPSRLTRIPGAARNGQRQQLLNLNVGAESWVEWETDRIASGLGTTYTVDDLESFDYRNDPSTLLGGENRYLCRGGSITLIGPSGVGKSSLIMQMAACWAVGEPCFGIKPNGPLKCLIVQAENDKGDLSEQLDGVRIGMGLDILSANPERVALFKRNLVVVAISSHVGDAFVRAFRVHAERHRPAIVFLDPALSFVGGDISKQDVSAHFFREGLNPIMKSVGFGLFVAHHTGKPPNDKDSRKHWQSSDWSYAGIGSSDLTNWTRGAMVIRQLPGGIFQLMMAKRGGRSGATHPDGQPTEVVWLRHARGSIHWEHVQPPEEPAEDAEPRRKGQDSGPKEERRKSGAPSKAKHALAILPWDEFAAKIPAEGWGLREICREAENWLAEHGQDLSEGPIRKTIIPDLVGSKKLAKRDGKYTRPKS